MQQLYDFPFCFENIELVIASPITLSISTSQIVSCMGTLGIYMQTLTLRIFITLLGFETQDAGNLCKLISCQINKINESKIK